MAFMRFVCYDLALSIDNPIKVALKTNMTTPSVAGEFCTLYVLPFQCAFISYASIPFTPAYPSLLIKLNSYDIGADGNLDIIRINQQNQPIILKNIHGKLVCFWAHYSFIAGKAKKIFS